MHGSAILLLPVVAAEKSKVPFFIAGGLLAVWAVVVSMLFGLRKPEFPGGLVGERIVIAISVVLVLAAVSTAVITSSSPAKSAEASAASAAQVAPAPPPSPPATSTTPTAPGAHKAAGGAAKATTGTPPPPSSPARAAPSTIALAADPTGLLRFDKKQISAKAGSVTIVFTNASGLEHNVTVAQGSTVLGATPSFAQGAKSVALTLKAGTYTFYCSVPGHRQSGMEGTLSVT